MKKYLFYVMRSDKMCFIHVLLNALDLKDSGAEVKIVFEGQAVTLPPILTAENNGLYKKVHEEGLIAGVCEACAKALGVYEQIKDLELPFLNDMNQHAGLRPFTTQGYLVLTF